MPYCGKSDNRKPAAMQWDYFGHVVVVSGFANVHWGGCENDNKNKTEPWPFNYTHGYGSKYNIWQTSWTDARQALLMNSCNSTLKKSIFSGWNLVKKDEPFKILISLRLSKYLQ